MNVAAKLPTTLNKFMQVAPVSANEFVARWRALGGPPTKLQEVVVISDLVMFLSWFVDASLLQFVVYQNVV